MKMATHFREWDEEEYPCFHCGAFDDDVRYYEDCEENLCRDCFLNWFDDE
jgi:hypothetical protein